jgi:hypothetical protein
MAGKRPHCYEVAGATKFASAFGVALVILKVNDLVRSRASAWQEAADLRYSLTIHVGPDDGWAEFIGLGDHGIVRHDDPLAVKAHTIFAVLRIPIDVLNADAICERTARPLAAGEMVEPVLERVIGIAAIVARLHRHKSTERKD